MCKLTATKVTLLTCVSHGDHLADHWGRGATLTATTLSPTELTKNLQPCPHPPLPPLNHPHTGAADQGGCGSCWTWATARAYAERLCQQSFYGVRIWPSPYLTENCYSHGAKPHMVCGGGNSEVRPHSIVI